MYSLLRNAPAKAVVTQQAPALVVAFGIASFFYKFGSFALECLAFLATWYVLDFLAARVRAVFPPPAG